MLQNNSNHRVIKSLKFQNNETSWALKLTRSLKNKGFTGDICQDNANRSLAATDNSIYELWPSMVIFPKSEQDIKLLLTQLQHTDYQNISITAKGGGTGTNGQSLNQGGIALDFSKYFTKILKLDLKAKVVTLQAGVVLDNLNTYLKPYGYFFPVEISTASRATLGGMLSTDASGKGSRLYGKTSDNLQAIKFWNHLGQSFTWQKTLLSDFLSHSQNQWEKSLATAIDKIYHTQKHLFSRHFPKINRSLTGYNLPKVLNSKQEIDLSALVCGSEGTLGIVSQLTLKIKKIPKYKAVAVIFYHTFEEAIQSFNEIFKFDAIAIETMDEQVTALAKQDSSWQNLKADLQKKFTKFGCFNVVEFNANSQKLITKKLAQLTDYIAKRQSKSHLNSGFYITQSEAEIESIWKLRSRAVGLLSSIDPTKKPVAFIEDCCVPPTKLLEFILEFKKLLQKHELKYAMYGHIDVGCIHVRPALDMRDPKDQQKIRTLSDSVQKLVQKHKGLLWGEHGKGVRGEYLPLYLGPKLYESMRQIKSLFDPKLKFNPGKLYMPFSSSLSNPDYIDKELYLIDNLALKGTKDNKIIKSKAAIKGYQAFKGVLDCNGNGECFSLKQSDLMCPSFKVSNNRLHSPKGRAMLLREWLFINTKLTKSTVLHSNSSDFAKQVFEALDGCLSCKACTSLCPSFIDIPEYKSQFLNRYYANKVRPLGDYLLAFLENFLPVLNLMPKLSNYFLGSKLVQAVVNKFFGLLDLPKLASPSLSISINLIDGKKNDLLNRTSILKYQAQNLAQANINSTQLTIVPDAFLYFYEPSVLLSGLSLLKKFGYKVAISKFNPNGKALHITGFLNKFRKAAIRHTNFLVKLTQSNQKLISLEPSSVMLYRQEYVKHLSTLPPKVLGFENFWQEEITKTNSPLAKNLAFWQTQVSKNQSSVDKASPLILFGHCNQNAAAVLEIKIWQKIFSSFGLELEVPQVGCCGMAGVFGHQARHYQTSIDVFNYSWADIVKNNPQAKFLVVGYSCRHQAKRITSQKFIHPLVYLDQILQF